MTDVLYKNPSLDRSYLEGLATQELIWLADRFGIEIPQDLERLFIIAELLDLDSEGINRWTGANKEENALIETDIPEPVPLPKQYNITFIEVLIRDPLWVFTFWEIKNADKEQHEKAPDFGGYRLKVVPLPDAKTLKKDEFFTISIEPEDGAWYIGFPPEGGRFRVELCALRNAGERVLASSRGFTLPALYAPPRRPSPEARYDNPLVQLSGAEDLQVIRNIDRPSRTKL
ncbi:MAG: DUF4912 domain-containing protein [Spirochaetaceae bacterium]|nr:DUF4912 domain-containing protein [Spirochaetaceae bacterium]